MQVLILIYITGVVGGKEHQLNYSKELNNREKLFGMVK